MKAQIKIKIKIFSAFSLERFPPLENDVNEWIEKEDIGPADIMKVCQSESASDRGDILTISVWYIPTTVTPSQLYDEWVVENLPKTNPPASTRPGVEYGADV